MDDGPHPLDTMVLHHLRGFPDELRRFSNFLKQAHGRSAIDFVLSRPAPENSFLAAVCRAVRDGEDAVTVVEAAEMLGIPPAAMLARSPAELPEPLWGEGRYRLWRRADIAALRDAPRRA
jgi:hypothetical protein